MSLQDLNEIGHAIQHVSYVCKNCSYLQFQFAVGSDRMSHCPFIILESMDCNVYHHGCRNAVRRITMQASQFKID